VVQSAGFGRMTDFRGDGRLTIDDIDIGAIKSLDISTTAIDKVSNSMLEKEAERLEYAVRGAWMAGYPYLHVYEPNHLSSGLAQQEPQERFTVKLPVYMPAYEKEHLREYADRVYSYTYDLNSVPGHQLKAALDNAQ